MAEERNLALARAEEGAAGPADPEATKEELQRRMEEARENITQTVSEIKETVVSQYQQVRESISDTLDWREQYRRHTLPITIGAVGVGAILGYSVGGALFGGERDLYEDEAEYDYEEEADRTTGSAARSYAPSPITGRRAAAAAPAALYAAGAPESSSGEGPDVGPETRPAYASAPQSQSLAVVPPPEPEKPSLFSRFKETKAYDRLTEEVSGLGDRVVEELSKTAQTVVLPLLLSKVKDLIGLDLNAQREVAKRTQLEQQTAKANAGTTEAANAAAAASGTSAPGGGPGR